MNSSKAAEYFNSNIERLLLRYPSFQADVLNRYKPSGLITVSETAEGLPTARIDNLWIHSSRQPVREAQKLARNGIKKKSGLCLVFGFGLGYHIEALMSEFPELQLLIVEADPALFLDSLSLRDYSTIIESERTGFILGTDPSVLSSVLNSFKTFNFQSFKLRTVYERNIDYYSAVDEEYRNFIRKKETNLNTLNRFGKTWTRNLFRNIEVFSKAVDSGTWYGLFSNIPALVIAAGPSLDELLPLLHELHKRCLLICVDTALRAVISAGVRPDFVVVVDPQYLNTRHLDNLLDSDALEGTILISESSTHPAVFRNCRLPVYFFRSVFPLGKMIEKHAGIVSELGAGGSVATTAWDFARKLSCPEIYAAGLDLGFPGKRTHCRNSLSSLYTQLMTNRLLSSDAVNFSGLLNGDPFLTENNSSGDTLTDNRLIIYKWWFEGQISNNPSGGLHNLSEHGIRIEGMDYRPVTDLLAKPEIRNSIDRLIARGQSGTGNKQEGMIQIRVLVETIVNECKRLEDICMSALDILSKLKGVTDREILESGFNRLSVLDSLISDSPSKELTGFIIQPVLNEIIDQDKSMFENSENLYSSIFDACEYHRIHAQRALTRMG